MEKITRNNYEVFFLDYHEGLLSGEQMAEVILFLEKNEDLMEEFYSFENVSLDPVLADAVAKLRRAGIRYRCVAPQGKPGKRICELADELSLNLLIIGSPDRRPTIAKGMPDIDRLLGGSLSDYVRVYANCPVLLTRIEA